MKPKKKVSKILLRDIKKAEAEYARAIIIWGEYNLITQRVMIKFHELKEEYERNHV